MFDLGGKTALVTGASGGLGLHFAGVLARAGAHVTLAARRVAALEAGVAALRDAGHAAAAVALDVTDVASVAATMAAPYDIVVNNAGIALDGPALQTSEDDWTRNTPDRSVSITRVQSSSLVCNAGPSSAIPALFTTMS